MLTFVVLRHSQSRPCLACTSTLRSVQLSFPRYHINRLWEEVNQFGSQPSPLITSSLDHYWFFRALNKECIVSGHFWGQFASAGWVEGWWEGSDRAWQTHIRITYWTKITTDFKKGKTNWFFPQTSVPQSFLVTRWTLDEAHLEALTAALPPALSHGGGRLGWTYTECIFYDSSCVKHAEQPGRSDSFSEESKACDSGVVLKW